MMFSWNFARKGLLIALVVLLGWSVWRRLDAVFDNWHQYYDVSLGVHLIRGLMADPGPGRSESFEAEFDPEWKAIGPVSPEALSKQGAADPAGAFPHRPLPLPAPAPTDPQTSAVRPPAPVEPPDTDPDWQRYERQSLVKPVPAPPVPYQAHMWLTGYYSGLWTFMLHSGLVLLIFVPTGLALAAWYWHHRRRRRAESAATEEGSEWLN